MLFTVSQNSSSLSETTCTQVKEDSRRKQVADTLSFDALRDVVVSTFPALENGGFRLYFMDEQNKRASITTNDELNEAFRLMRELAEDNNKDANKAVCEIIVVAKEASASLAIDASSSSMAPSDSSAESQRLKQTLASVVHEEFEKARAKRLQDNTESTSSKRPRSENVESLDSVPQVDIQNCGDYVTLPKALLEKCGLFAHDDLMLYCRPQLRELWAFLEQNVIEDNSKPMIVGPPGTGKSACVLSFLSSLDRQEWNVVWIHLKKGMSSTCLAMGSKKYWRFDTRSEFVMPRVAGKNLIICLDGYKRTDADDRFMVHIDANLRNDDRLVICSSMATFGKRNKDDDADSKIKKFYMYSWTQDEYLEAISDLQFYEKIMARLDATSSNEVNDDDNDGDQELSENNDNDDGDQELGENDDDDDGDQEWSEKKHAVALKFYYAGGSCRFMFQCSTDEVIQDLLDGIECAPNTADLVRYCSGSFHDNTVNMFYGMQGNSNTDGKRFPVSSYVASLFAKQCDETVIAMLADRLNASKNPALDGHIFEWLFLAAVSQREVELFADQNRYDKLPQANVLAFDPKKRFKKWPKNRTTRYPGVITHRHEDGTYDIDYDDGKKNTTVIAKRIKLRGEEHKSMQVAFNVGDEVSVLPNSLVISGNQSWLQPVAWNQGGYDAVYFNVDENKVIFVQVTRSDKHSFKMFYFNEVLLKLRWAGMANPKVEVYFVVKPSQTLGFSLSMVEDRRLLEGFDARWKGREEDKVKVRGFGKAFNLI